METVILASGSPRRSDLLTLAGIPFEVAPADVDESCALPAEEAVRTLSRRKAVRSALLHPRRYIVAADTLVSLDESILGKPTGPEDAVHMLRALSGRTHQVFTGITVIAPSGETVTSSDRSDVSFIPVPEAEIQDYVRSGEPLDKAGAYAIQGRAALWISRLDGCPTSVIGLPLPLLRSALEQIGYPF